MSHSFLIPLPSRARTWRQRAAGVAVSVLLSACGGGGGASSTGSGASGATTPDATGPLAGAPRQVVVVGYALGNVPGSPQLGRLWVQGAEKALPVGASGQSVASSVAFVGSAPVVAGHYPFHTGPLGAYHEAKLWHQGETAQFLPVTATGSHVAQAIQATAGDVHVAGTREGSYHKAVYWKNGEVRYLNPVDDTTYEGASGLGVSDEGVVYISGYDFGSAQSVGFNPVIWRNGVKTKLSSSVGSATGVAVRSLDVHVSGYLRFADGTADSAVLWKNGALQRLGDGSSSSLARAVVTGGLDDVYAVGADHVQTSSVRAVLWKNGVEQALEGAGAGSEAYAVKVVGSDVYVAGHVGASGGGKQAAALWVNGKLQRLSDGSLMTWATGLAVQ